MLQTDWGQNWLVRQVTKKLSRDLQSRISIKHVNIGFFNYLNLEGVLVEDQKRDTLLAAGLVQVRITDWFFFKDKADLKYIGLENAVITVNAGVLDIGDRVTTNDANALPSTVSVVMNGGAIDFFQNQTISGLSGTNGIVRIGANTSGNRSS